MMRSLALRALSVGAALGLGAAALVAQPPAQPRRGAEQAPRAGQMDRAGGRVFRDITLTDAQRARVREVQRRHAEERRQLAATARAQRPQPPRGARSDSLARQRPDSATRVARRAEREAMRTRMQQLSARHLADLRAVLEPSQQATFDRNVGELRQRMDARGQGRGERGMRRAPKARPGGAARPGAPATTRGA